MGRPIERAQLSVAQQTGQPTHTRSILHESSCSVVVVVVAFVYHTTDVRLLHLVVNNDLVFHTAFASVFIKVFLLRFRLLRHFDK